MVSAQKTVKLILTDKESSLPIEGVSITSDNFEYHAISNSQGLIELEAQIADSLRFVIRHISYKEKILWIREKESLYELELNPLQVKIESVNVSAIQNKKKSRSLSSVLISKADLDQIPNHLGEADIIKVLELQPGVVRTNELNPALNVRGGSGGHNSFVLDGQPIFNPNHLLGILSTFNSDLMESASMVKDGYHPNLGGSLSSFIEVKNRIGNKKKISGKLGVGLLSSRFSLEGPLKKDKVSFLFGARRSYFDLFAKSYNKINEGKEDFSPLPEYNFQDFQLKLHAKINKNWFAEVEMFRSSDKLDLLKEENGKRLVTDWSNQFASFHLKHYSNANFHAHFVSGIGRYKFNLQRDYNNLLSVDSKTKVWNNRLDFHFQALPKLELTTGMFFEFYTFNYQNQLQDTDVLLKETRSDKDAIYTGAYLNLKYALLDNLVFNLGGRLNNYLQDNWIHKLSPRLSATYKISNDLSLNVNYGVTHQFNHLLSTYGMNLPNDIWYPSNSGIPSEEANQLAISMEKQWLTNFSIRLSSYFKKMKNIIDYNDGSDLLFDNIENEVLLGKGESKGIEFDAAWKGKRLNTRLFYTLSDTWRRFDNLNSGRRFHPSFDIKHKLNLIHTYNISDKLTFSASWTYASGQLVSFPVSAVVLQGSGSQVADAKVIPIYKDRYNLRMASTHRLDVSLRYTQKRKHGRSIISVGIYNVYNRSNPYFIYFETEKNDNGTSRFLPKQKALIPFLPTINYTYEFN